MVFRNYIRSGKLPFISIAFHKNIATRTIDRDTWYDVHPIGEDMLTGNLLPWTQLAHVVQLDSNGESRRVVTRNLQQSDLTTNFGIISKPLLDSMPSRMTCSPICWKSHAVIFHAIEYDLYNRKAGAQEYYQPHFCYHTSLIVYMEEYTRDSSMSTMERRPWMVVAYNSI